MDLSIYTTGENREVVKVAEFRNRIAHLERIFHADWCACVGEAERNYNLRIMERIGRELIDTTCKRATKQDWERREKIIDSSTSRLCEYKKAINPGDKIKAFDHQPREDRKDLYVEGVVTEVEKNCYHIDVTKDTIFPKGHRTKVIVPKPGFIMFGDYDGRVTKIEQENNTNV